MSELRSGLSYRTFGEPERARQFYEPAYANMSTDGFASLARIAYGGVAGYRGSTASEGPLDTPASGSARQMSEVGLAITMTEERESWDHEKRVASETAFAAALHEAMVTVDAIHSDRNRIRKYGGVLIRDLRLSPELFKDQANVIIFSALAQRKADIESQPPIIDADTYENETAIINEATLLLACETSEYYPQFRKAMGERSLTDREVAGVYDAFTDPEATEGLRTMFTARSYVTQEFRDAAQLGDEHGGPHVLHVLNIGDERSLRGTNYTKARKTKLIQSQADFMKAADIRSVPVGWVDTLDGRKHLCLPVALVQKVVNRATHAAGNYSARHYSSDLAVITHELVHTTNGLRADGNPFFGLGLEERRAEVLSDDRNGYQDIKMFFDESVKRLTGFDMAAYCKQIPARTVADGFYRMLANQVGLQHMLDMTLATPRLYLEIDGAPPLMCSLQHRLGGLDGLERRMYGRLTAEERGYFHTALDVWVKEVADDPECRQLLDEQRRLDQGPHFIMDMLRARVDTYRQGETRSKLLERILTVD